MAETIHQNECVCCQQWGLPFCTKSYWAHKPVCKQKPRAGRTQLVVSPLRDTQLRGEIFKKKNWPSASLDPSGGLPAFPILRQDPMVHPPLFPTGGPKLETVPMVHPRLGVRIGSPGHRASFEQLGGGGEKKKKNPVGFRQNRFPDPRKKNRKFQPGTHRCARPAPCPRLLSPQNGCDVRAFRGQRRGVRKSNPLRIQNGAPKKNGLRQAPNLAEKQFRTRKVTEGH